MTDQPIYAWHNDQALRDATIAKLHEHRTQDRFIQGAYSQGSGKNWKGCWYGCLTGEPIEVHQFAYDKFGIHPCVGALIEQCYERLPIDVAVDTVLNLTESIPVGADLRVIYSRWVCDWLAPRLHVMAVADQQVLAAIEGVTGIFANDAWPAYAAAKAAAYAACAARVEDVPFVEAADAAAYAAAKASYAACAAAYAAAYAAADAASYAARAAADAAAYAASYAASYAAAWQSLADWLLAELPKCPCPVMEVMK